MANIDWDTVNQTYQGLLGTDIVGNPSAQYQGYEFAGPIQGFQPFDPFANPIPPPSAAAAPVESAQNSMPGYQYQDWMNSIVGTSGPGSGGWDAAQGNILSPAAAWGAYRNEYGLPSNSPQFYGFGWF